MSAVDTAWWTPFDEEQIARRRIVAWCLVRLVRQTLNMLNLSVRPNDVEEAGIVCNEVCFVQICESGTVTLAKNNSQTKGYERLSNTIVRDYSLVWGVER